MTECDRIIEQGILPKSFFEAEIICDFFVSEKTKKIWAIGIDLLVQLDRVCREHSLSYSLAFGSLLGFIRHNGFIPWDDDIDVFMPREDYEKLRKLKEEFHSPYYLQFPGEDNGYAFTFAKLRNSYTTGISWAFRHESFNQGLFIDIFPLDNYRSENIEDNIEKLKALVAEGSALMRRSNPNPDDVDKAKLNLFPVTRPLESIVKDTDNFLQQYNDVDSDCFIAWSILTYHYRHIIYNKELFNDLQEVVYYGHRTYIPRRYDDVLTITYGDYMELPPIEQRGNWHSKNIFDPDVPYLKYLNRIRNENTGE